MKIILANNKHNWPVINVMPAQERNHSNSIHKPIKSSEFTIDLFEEAWCPPENGAVVDPCWISGQDLPQLASYLCLRLGRDQGTFLLCCCWLLLGRVCKWIVSFCLSSSTEWALETQESRTSVPYCRVAIPQITTNPSLQRWWSKYFAYQRIFGRWLRYFLR